ncbi:MAG: hypothetical protein H6613_06120 [Ignavibacteriales bacterium]|nr:hypothetical protein [Ignavibacteriota bacterium]MCB9248133.1 hypothetical protein [Ignavibacteriales bacterium]
MERKKLETFFTFTIILMISIYSLFATSGKMVKLQNYFQNCEYQKAIELAEIILKDISLKGNDKTEILIIKGVSEFSLNKIAAAEETFTELLLLNENITLDTRAVSPKIVEFFNELKNKANLKLVYAI